MNNSCAFVAVPTAALLLLCGTLQVMARPQQVTPTCPETHAATYPFDSTYVHFNSAVQNLAGGQSIMYCVQVEAAKRAYLVNWPDIQWVDVATRKDGLLVSYGPEITHRPVLEGTEVYLGANQRIFTPTVMKEVSIGREIVDQGEKLITRFFGSVPVNPTATSNANEFVPVDFEFIASQQGELAQLNFVNEERAGSRLFNFKLSTRIGNTIPQLATVFAIGPETRTVSYKGSQNPTPQRVVLALMNSDLQIVARIPIVIYAP